VKSLRESLEEYGGKACRAVTRAVSASRSGDWVISRLVCILHYTHARPRISTEHYRLSVFPIVLPPLRERKEDIPLLVHFLVHQFASRIGKRIDGVTELTMRRLSAAHLLGLHANTLRHRMKKLGITRASHQIR
jgi:transcriptional regulator with AAA-type ATPase domain